jgi:hypothetical protein
MFYLAIIFPVLSGCEAVFTEQPLGEEIRILDVETWQGTWLSNGVVLMTTVIDAENGVMQAAWLERGEEGARTESYTGFVRQTGDWVFLNMEHQPEEAAEDLTEVPDKDSQENASPEYFWARVENDGRRVILWWPNTDEMRKAINSGKIPGIVKEDKDVQLAPLESQHLELINAPGSNLLNWAEPDVFIRIAD